MKKTAFVLFAIISVVFACQADTQPKAPPKLNYIATYDTGLGDRGSEIISIRQKDGIAALTNIDGSVDLVDLSNPFHPERLRRVAVDTSRGTPNSVAVHPYYDYFLVVTGSAGNVGVVAAYRLSDGALLATAPAGIQPDSIAISPNGKYAVIANEAEGEDFGMNGGDGSLSVVDLTRFNGTSPSGLLATNISLPSLAAIPGVSSRRVDDIARLPIANLPGSLEPEYVAFTSNSRFAYVTLQENNAVLRLDLQDLNLVAFGLGQTTHNADLINDGLYSPLANALTAFREPDAIALDQTGRFFVTADEGDTRNGEGVTGPRGGRTVSIFDAGNGELLSDTGSQLDETAAAARIYPDGRSNRGGSEPEGLDLTHVRGLTLVAVGLERANAVALIDVSNPKFPKVLALAAVGTQPEGIKFFRKGNELFVAAANEGAGTVSILQVVFPRED
jgi:uncharacterized protein